MRLSRTETSSYRGPRGTFVPPSPTVPTDDSRPSNESGGRARPSHDSSGRSSGAPRASLADSHVSVYSTSFGPIMGRSRHARSSARSERPSEDVGSARSYPKSATSDDIMIQPPPSSLLTNNSLPSTGSEVGLHSFGGVGQIQLANTPGPIPRPARSSTAPQPSSLASRRSQLLRPLDLLSVSSLGPSMGVRSAPPVERDSMGPGSFLDFDLPLSATGWKDGDWAPEEPPVPEEESLVYVDTASNSRSRVPSNAATIVPSPMKGIFAAAGASGSSTHAANEPVLMRFPNHSNPYLQNPYAEIDPTRPLTNTPSGTTQSGFISTTLSTLSSLNLLSRRDSFGRKGAKQKRGEIPFDLKRYAQDPKARSTPTLSPSHKVFADVAPGRHSNVSGSRGRFGHGFMDMDPSDDRAQWVTPEQRKLDGLVAQHLQAERDLLKKVAKGAARPDRA